jgi:hypothetical protein
MTFKIPPKIFSNKLFRFSTPRIENGKNFPVETMKESPQKMKEYLYKIKKKLIFDEHMSKYSDFDVPQPPVELIF